MTTLADLEREGKAALLEQQRIAEEKQRENEETAQQDRQRMFDAVLAALAEHSGVDADGLRPLLRVDREYRPGTFTARLVRSATQPDSATIHFGCLAEPAPTDDDILALDVSVKDGRKPFFFTWRNPTYYTLGEALAVARARQERADAYDAQAAEEDRLAAERYEARQAKEAEARNDRITFLTSLVDEHPILFPLLKVLIAYMNREADLQDELEAVANY